MSMPTLEIVIPEVQVQGEPVAGMMIVSPFTALCVGPLMTAFTSDWLHEAAVKVPCARHNEAPNKTKVNMAKKILARARKRVDGGKFARKRSTPSPNPADVRRPVA
jgi:hypothetical protein